MSGQKCPKRLQQCDLSHAHHSSIRSPSNPHVPPSLLSSHSYFTTSSLTCPSCVSSDNLLHLHDENTTHGQMTHPHPQAQAEELRSVLAQSQEREKERVKERGEREKKRRKEKEGRKLGCFRIHIYLRNAFLTA